MTPETQSEESPAMTSTISTFMGMDSNNLTAAMLAGGDAFAHVQRVANMFAKSDLVPVQFQGKVGNVIIALEMAQRMGANALSVMQNLYVVHGKPGWSSQFLIASLNTCGRFEPLRFDVEGLGEDRTCIAWTLDKGTKLPPGTATLHDCRDAGIPLYESPPVSIRMAKQEGWLGKNGSKWQTMPELMLRYRAATFFTRLYAPEITMGMQTVEEIRDVTPKDEPPAPSKPKFLNKTPAAPEPEAQPETVTPEVIPPEGLPIQQSKSKEELLRDLKSLQDEHAVSDTQVKAWAVRENVITSQATMLKNYEVSALEYIIANWNDCVEGSHSV